MYNMGDWGKSPSVPGPKRDRSRGKWKSSIGEGENGNIMIGVKGDGKLV